MLRLGMEAMGQVTRVADVVFGDVNLRQNIFVSHQKRRQPCILNYRSKLVECCIAEIVYVGYRYYDTLKLSVAFPFGHGLSYSTFSFQA